MKSSIFKYSYSVAGLILVSLLLWMGVHLFTVSDRDRAAYQTLLEETLPINTTSSVTPYTAKQHRRSGQKDLFFQQGNERLQLRLTSVEALMIVDHKEEKTDLIEKMRGVKCWMQEELYYVCRDGKEALKQSNGKLLVRHADSNAPGVWREIADATPMQIVRYLEADAATYSYKTEQVEASHVNIARYQLPGHVLVYNFQGVKPQLTGTAQSAEFSLAGGEINFKAHKMKASYAGGAP